jgi:uncharacterized protein YecT (DUF1311 family)
MKNRPAYGALFACLGVGIPAAQAAGIDCGKAHSPAEKAICASPELLALDRQVAAAYADALARQPQQKDAMRQDLIRWLKHRDTVCALPTPDVARCLTSQLTARLADVAPSAPPSGATAPVAAAPAEALQTAPPPARPADPAIPPDILPQGAATLEQTQLAAAERAETMLRVNSAGRFAIAAKSASGAAIQLIDILTGPGAFAGIPGARDGRLDALLDVGVYKLRVTSDPVATGSVALVVSPFRDAAPPAALPQPGFPLTAALRDGEQRAFWLTVPPDGGVRIEAAGRSLGDLRLWRDGRELTALEAAAMRVEPVSGHPLTDLRLEGKVEPGTYLAVAYGGPPLTWTDNDPDQSFLLRSGASPALAEGRAVGPMGPFGSEVFDVPAATGLVRLSLPASAAAELRAGDSVATLSRGSREPMVHLSVTPGKAPTVELRAAAGQPFTLQALEQPVATSISRPGTYWVSAVVNGAGGDEVPAGVLLQRSESADKPPRIVAGTLPRVGPGTAWHARFNLRGPTTLLVENTAGGELAVRSSGVSVRQHGQPGVYDLAADYYGLNLTPVDGAQGSLDLVAGPPGAATPPLMSLPADPVVPFGVQTLGPGQSLQVLGPSAPGVQLGLSARRVPVALAEGPLTVTQAVGSALAIPVTLAAGGTLAVSEIGGGPIGFGLQGTSGGASTVVLPLADHPRTVVLAWRRAVSPIPVAVPRPPGTGVALQPGRPASLDLMRGESRGFALTLPQGGLYRVETLGRLRTAGRIATAFVPRLQEAEANGVGQNMLLQQVLRAGAYQVDVTALESAGHLGVSVTPAPVLLGAALSPGGSVRASLPAGSAISFPLAIAEPNRRYRLDVPALGSPWQGRIEDAQGWPMTATGPLDGTTPALPPGDYRLVVSPASVDRKVVARLTEIAGAPEITGHGPHRLPFEAPQAAVWREPEARDQPRIPDSWSFDQAGPAKVALDLGDGMTGELYRAGEAAPLARITGHYAEKLEAGQYRVDAASLGRNDRLAYTIALTSQALQPGVPRTVALPSTTEFAIAEARVVSLTSFGNTPVRAVLRGDDGRVVARIGARADDWNIAASRLLPAGRYQLDLAAASPPELSKAIGTPSPATEEDAGNKGEDDDEAEPEAGQPPAPPDNAQSDVAKPVDDAPVAGSPSTELRLALPEALPAIAAPARTTEVTGAGVHVLNLDPAAPGKLLVAQAASGASLVLALERLTAGGWQIVALDEGNAPIVASPADADQAPWRVEVWTVDGGAQSIRVAARSLEVTPQPAGRVALAALDDMPAAVAIAHVALDSAAPVAIEPAPGLLAGGWAGQALASLNGPVLPQARDVWLLGHEAGTATVAPLPFTGARVIIVPPGQVAQLAAAAPPAGHVAIWRAEGGFAQPGLGAAAGIGNFSAVALADRPVVLRNASGDGPLRVALTRLDLELLPARTLAAALQTTLPPGSALPLRLPGGDKVLQADMGAEVAAFAGQTAVWAGAAPVSRSLQGGWTDILLVNAGSAAAPARLAWQPAPPVAPLRAGTVLKRFFGAGGSFELRFDAASGAHLVSAGDASLTAIAADGAVRRGQDIVLSGTGRAVVEHGIGPIAVWLAADGVSPWPDAAVQQVKPPARLTLAGAAMALGLKQDSPSLLHVSTTAPVLAALVQSRRTDPPRLFPAGAELHVMLAAGAAELRLYPPSDGPLSGSLLLSAEPVTPIGEGLGAPVSVAPGQSAVFAFSVAKAATIGVGVRADPDRASVRLLDASGAVLGEGVAQLRALRAGQYLIEAQVPPDAGPTILRPAVIGITPRGSGPPPDVARQYLEVVGLKPAQGTTP